MICATSSVELRCVFKRAQASPVLQLALKCFNYARFAASVIKRGTGRRALALGRSHIAGKTGTTNEAKDTWFNGFTRNLVAPAWVGFDQERSLGEAEEGARTGLPIWIQFMREALQGVPEQRRSRTAAALEQTRD